LCRSIALFCLLTRFLVLSLALALLPMRREGGGGEVGRRGCICILKVFLTCKGCHI